MKQVFDGHNQARQFAELESRKQRTELTVVLTKDDGIKYVVVDSIDKHKVKGKTIDRYKNGEIFNGESKPEVIAPPKVFVAPAPPPLPKSEPEVKKEEPKTEAPLAENPSVIPPVEKDKKEDK